MTTAFCVKCRKTVEILNEFQDVSHGIRGARILIKGKCACGQNVCRIGKSKG
jgi:hypothetical protein